MKKRIRFIVNPFSGVQRKKLNLSVIEKHLDTDLYDVDLVETKKAGDAITLSKEAVDKNYDTVVAVGGDGSINEVASQLVHTETNLAIIPTGSGNGFASFLGYKRNDLQYALETINHRNIEIIDSATLNDHFFINVAGIGFDGRISYAVKKGKKRGIQMYVKKAIKEASAFQFIDLNIQADEASFSGSFATVVAANGQMYGTNYTISPLSDLQDGLLDLIMIKKASKILYFLYAWRFFNRSIHKSRYVEVIKAKKINIQLLSEDAYFHLDGEGAKYSKELEFKIVPNSIRIIKP